MKLMHEPRGIPVTVEYPALQVLLDLYGEDRVMQVIGKQLLHHGIASKVDGQKKAQLEDDTIVIKTEWNLADKELWETTKASNVYPEKAEWMNKARSFLKKKAKLEAPKTKLQELDRDTTDFKNIVAIARAMREEHEENEDKFADLI